jgi:hypothetical protein
MRSFHPAWASVDYLPCSSLSLQFNIINKALLQGDRKEGVGSKTKNLASGLLHAAKSAEAYRSIAGRVSIQGYTFLHGQGNGLRRRMKWELDSRGTFLQCVLDIIEGGLEQG